MFNNILKYSETGQFITIGVIDPWSLVYLIQHGFSSSRLVPQYHEYTPFNAYNFTGVISQRLAVIPAHTSFDRILIGEVGAPSNCTANGMVYTESVQQQFFNSVLGVYQSSNTVLGVMVWTLYDWNYSGTQQNCEKYFGIYRGNNSTKPAYNVVNTFFAPSP
jgi:exo-beta-1,3-glucanase (GH17 family)